MRELYLKLTVPDVVDPEEVVETMSNDYFYGNRYTMEERFPDEDVMANIVLEIIRGEVHVLAQ